MREKTLIEMRNRILNLEKVLTVALVRIEALEKNFEKKEE